ncbi:MAG: glutathione S-transferase [Candidatus Azotimanducaceae bacterium]|jgi:glutathione S-transferase
MKLYYFPYAPNPTKVRTYIAEKGIEIEQVLVNISEDEQKSEIHLQRNPTGTLPVLELDNGDYLSESLTIIEYLEEIYPSPNMIGSDPLTRATIREVERQVEHEILLRVIRIIHTTNSPLGFPANPAVAENEMNHLPDALKRIDKLIDDQTFVMGSHVTIVDCTLFSALFFAELCELDISKEYLNLHRWYEDFKQRPSAQP